MFELELIPNQCSRGVKRQNQNRSLLYKKCLPKRLTQNNNGFRYSLSQIKNRYKTVRALALGNFPNHSRLNELLGA